MTAQDPQVNDSGPDEAAWLTHQWVVAGIISASARFIPVPFVDDVVRARCHRFVVSRTIAACGENQSIEDLKPYYSDDAGCLTGCFGWLLKAPVKLMLFPIRKVVAIVTSVRGVPLEIIKSDLLGRTLQRQFGEHPITAEHAAKMRIAFEEAFSRMDFHAVRAAVSDAIHGVSDLKQGALQTARQVERGRDLESSEIQPDPSVEQGAANVQEVLRQPATTKLFAEFDLRFDESLSRLSQLA